ncbi:hypothetical protein AYI70_g5867 [Smittium culicis]|uniref:Uncharacterized protein n=1 Tax=Smittium culicis TaxID=133412 RepID=A0A1R1XSM7_9FUNG|nr:hypothetical protein AYI70_g5867 [Smittium culicis]
MNRIKHASQKPYDPDESKKDHINDSFQDNKIIKPAPIIKDIPQSTDRNLSRLSEDYNLCYLKKTNTELTKNAQSQVYKSLPKTPNIISQLKIETEKYSLDKSSVFTVNSNILSENVSIIEKNNSYTDDNIETCKYNREFNENMLNFDKIKVPSYQELQGRDLCELKETRIFKF